MLPGLLGGRGAALRLATLRRTGRELCLELEAAPWNALELRNSSFSLRKLAPMQIPGRLVIGDIEHDLENSPTDLASLVWACSFFRLASQWGWKACTAG